MIASPVGPQTPLAFFTMAAPYVGTVMSIMASTQANIAACAAAPSGDNCIGSTYVTGLYQTIDSDYINGAMVQKANGVWGPTGEAIMNYLNNANFLYGSTQVNPWLDQVIFVNLNNTIINPTSPYGLYTQFTQTIYKCELVNGAWAWASIAGASSDAAYMTTYYNGVDVNAPLISGGSYYDLLNNGTNLYQAVTPTNAALVMNTMISGAMSRRSSKRSKAVTRTKPLHRHSKAKRTGGPPTTAASSALIIDTVCADGIPQALNAAFGLSLPTTCAGGWDSEYCNVASCLCCTDLTATSPIKSLLQGYTLVTPLAHCTVLGFTKNFECVHV